MESPAFVASLEIERETGFGKDQLRKWRQRFGLPPVASGPDGRPAYARATIAQLLLIRRLLDTGLRPGQVVGKSLDELQDLVQAVSQSLPAAPRDASTQAFIERLLKLDQPGFKALLTEAGARQSLLDLMAHSIAPLLTHIGEAWRRNELDIHHEHLGTCCIKRYLHAQTHGLASRAGYPSILFALPPGEQHVLGLLMTEAVLAEQGARTIQIASELPLNKLALAASAFEVDALALSFSSAYPRRTVLPTLLHVRRLLPPHIQLWAGGTGVAGISRRPKGVLLFSDFDQAIAALQGLRQGSPA